MSIQIEQNKRGWLATRGNSNEFLSDGQLYSYLIAKRAEGFTIRFTMKP